MKSFKELSNNLNEEKLNEATVDDVAKIQKLLEESFSLMKKNSNIYETKSTIYKLHKSLYNEHTNFIKRVLNS